MGVCDRLFTIRMPALTFVLGHIVRTSRGQQGVAGMDEQLYLLVMCRAICLAQRDSSVLVQR